MHHVERLPGIRDARERQYGLSKLAWWFVDSMKDWDRIVAVIGPSAVPDSMDTVLAYGLAWQGDADFLLIAPSELVGPESTTVLRLTCIETPVRVFGYDRVLSNSVQFPSAHLMRPSLPFGWTERSPSRFSGI